MLLSLPGWAPQQRSASLLEWCGQYSQTHSSCRHTRQSHICATRNSFDIPEDFSALYQDMDFRTTLKVVPVKPVVHTLSSEEEIEFDSPPPWESSDTISTHSSSSNTIILSSSDESGTSRCSQPWFEIPTFSFDVEQHLQAGNQVFLKDGTMLNHPSLTSIILEKLGEVVFGYTAYPTGIQILTVVEALIKKKMSQGLLMAFRGGNRGWNGK